MFLTKLAEKSGLWDLVAPKQPKKSNEDCNHVDKKNRISKEKEKIDKDALKRAEYAKCLAERIMRLQTQLELENVAEKNGVFAKKQRVKYHHKSTDTHYRAIVVGVHFDDGPDRPYYTIKYDKPETHTDSDGTVNTTYHLVEKQTDANRLMKVPWDEDKTWDIIK
mmetsp:Transcript_4075/g.3857  ORF Transcript_4075/g.3857 Transcript_4075/m.3857 type:complete len:165 (-) Transcript_4075:178-672(-)